jgi:hypothetical protein
MHRDREAARLEETVAPCFSESLSSQCGDGGDSWRAGIAVKKYVVKFLRGSIYWYASTIRGMLDNPAYIGRAAFGRAHFLAPRPRLRPIRRYLKPSPRATSRVAAPRDEWIEIPVPALFEAARGQLDENRSRKRDREPGQRWLLQGLTVCRRCGYAYYGKKAPRSRTYDPANTLRYYRCTGADGYRFNGKALCHNGPVRSDQLEQVGASCLEPSEISLGAARPRGRRISATHRPSA